jgi:putative transposase
MAESSFTMLECELLDRTVFETTTLPAWPVFDFVEAFYNPWRRHSSIGNLSAAEFERSWHGGSPSREPA